jgi:anti-anti-sigma factor
MRFKRWLRRRQPGAAPAAPPVDDPGRPLTVDARVEPDCTLLTVVGEIDISTSPDLSAAIEPHVGRTGAPLVVDLRGVSFMESTGLRVLLALERERARRGGPLAIVCPPGPARLICEVAAIEGQLSLYASAAEAAAALRRPRPD